MFDREDAGGNWAEDKNVLNGVSEYYVLSTSNDQTPPVISSIATSSVSDIGAVVSWLTDEVSNSFVEWGTVSGVYASSTAHATYDATHSLSLDGLSAVTRYYFHVVSADQNGNTATSSEYDFLTLEKQYGESQRIVQQVVTVQGGSNIIQQNTTIQGIAQDVYECAQGGLRCGRERSRKEIG